MINKSTVRLNNRERFLNCIELRKKGLSYSEIRKEIPIAKSTLQNWLTLAGLTLTDEHLQIQSRKRRENWKNVGAEASIVVRRERNKLILENFIDKYGKYCDEPLFLQGIMSYEAEGSKNGSCKFSNSDFRMIQLFINFIEKYFGLSRNTNIKFRLYIHESRSEDLDRIKSYWANKLSISSENILVTWKRNIVIRKRKNKDYFGQMGLQVSGEKLITRKILTMSDIIMHSYCGVV